jgi:hypothetical protein
VLLRLPKDLHRSLVRSAAAAGLSVNELCLRRLAAATPEDSSPARALVVGRAQAVFGDRLHGVVALGSWARAEAAAGSDIDVLVVIDPAVALTRDLYRTWDTVPLAVDAHAIDAHFAHLPAPGALPTPVWCEAGVDGLVWYDRGGHIAARLADVRRAIADRRVVRAFAHGQPYWKGAA